MLTIFSIPKATTDKHISLIQRNAIGSWCQLKPKCEIFLVGAENTTATLAKEFGVGYLERVTKTRLGTPLLDEAFDLTRRASSGNFMCYVNADILLLSSFMDIFRHLPNRNFLVVGQRWDLNINKEINFHSLNWENEVLRQVNIKGKIHPPSGSDFFVFPRGAFIQMPRFAVGRVGWDNWMIYQAWKESKMILDATPITKVIHQSHGYNHYLKSGLSVEDLRFHEGQQNIHLIGEKRRIFTIEDVGWRLNTKGIERKNLSLRLIKKYWQNSSSIIELVRHFLSMIAPFLYAPNQKTIVIIDNDYKRRLGNLLWNFICVVAYCLERGYHCQNHTFINYAEFFNFRIDNPVVRLMLFGRFSKTKLFQRIKPQRIYGALIRKFFTSNIITDNRAQVFYLPPTHNKVAWQTKALEEFEGSDKKIAYFDGWLFRNPEGIEKYRAQILQLFSPQKSYAQRVDKFISHLRQSFKSVIGVHVRMSDYRTYEGGKYHFSLIEVKKTLDSYLQYSHKSKDKTVFIICSEEKIDLSIFSDLKVVPGLGGTIEDLFTLAQTDLIIGSNSTYGAFAAYYGNIPIAVFARPKIDWRKIAGQTKFNYYNDCTLVHQ